MAADRQFTWDADFPGFGLQTTNAGHKSFIYQYRAGAVSRRMKLDGSWFRYEAERAGKSAPALKGTPRAVAKREAEAVRGAVAQGRDPLAEVRKAKTADKNTFKAVAEDYLARDGSRLRSKDQIRDVLERLVYPQIRRQADRRNQAQPDHEVSGQDRIRERAGHGRPGARPCAKDIQHARRANR
jgi:hypothetical protein